jgi:NADPH:quinone reductase-like Zn-dependent oxidoreductase
MKEAIVAKGPKVTIRDVDIPEPQADQVIIKVVVSGSNPKDWYVVTPSNLYTFHDSIRVRFMYV